MCYTGDHAQAAAMWRKPSEFNDKFTANGYEISMMSSAGVTAESALRAWLGSPGHEAVISERNGWNGFKAMGVGIHESYAHVWFANDWDNVRMEKC